MTETILRDIEEYSDERFVVKPVFDGTYCMSKLAHLKPGQSVPVHAHPNKEVILVPQKGEAVLIGEDGGEHELTAGTVYNEGVGPVFGFANRGSEPFQMLVLLVNTSREVQ